MLNIEFHISNQNKEMLVIVKQYAFKHGYARSMSEVLKLSTSLEADGS